MKTKFTFGCGILLSIALFSCKPLMKTYYGISDPKIESKQTVNKYLIKKDVKLKNPYFVKNLQSYLKLTNNVMIPNSFFFNKNGYFVDYNKTPKNCNANVGNFITDLKSLDQQENKSKRLQDVMRYIVDENGNTVKFEDGYDVYVLITWAKYVGKLNQEKAFDWQHLIEKTDFGSLKVKYYMINCDFMDSWDDIPADSGLKKA